MASSSCESPGRREFPLQLATGVIIDLLAKELDAAFSPSDEAKKAAFEASKSSLARRLTLIMKQIGEAHPSLVAEAFGELVREVCKCWRLRPELTSGASSIISNLESSVSLKTLFTVFDASRKASGPHGSILTLGGFLVHEAVYGLAGHAGKKGAKATPAELEPHLLVLLEWWSDEVCIKRWGVTDAWGLWPVEDDCRVSPLHAISTTGLVSLIPLALARGCSVNGDVSGSWAASPAFGALTSLRVQAFQLLLDHGLNIMQPYGEDGWPFALWFFKHGKGPAELFSWLLLACPEIRLARSRDDASSSLNLLGAAIRSSNYDAVEAALSRGAPVEYRSRIVEGKFIMCTSLGDAIRIGDPRILKLLIEEGKVLENWRDRYDKAALAEISMNLAWLAISAYPSNPRFSVDADNFPQHNSQATECVEMVLATGLVCPWGFNGGNSLHAVIYPRPAWGQKQQSSLVEEHALELFKRFHAAGFDVLHSAEADALNPAVPYAGLPHIAADAGHNQTMDWCIGSLGVSAEPLDNQDFNGVASLLFICLRHCNADGAKLLLEKYKVRAAYPERPLGSQPIVAMVGPLPVYTEADAEKVIRALIERDPLLLDIPCFSEEAIAAAVAPTFASGTALSWNPVLQLMFHPHTRALEALLSSRIRGIAELATRPVHVQEHFRLTPAMAALTKSYWDGLELLLTYTDVSVTERIDGQICIVDFLARELGKPGGPPRALIAKVEPRARKELADKAKASAANQAAAGKTTNAFEDPTVKPHGKKIKKKTGKKRRKARRRNGAANAGAGGAGAITRDSDEDGSSSDDGGDEIEPDDNLVDSRNAPSLDLLLEQMGLKSPDAEGSATAPADQGRKE